MPDDVAGSGATARSHLPPGYEPSPGSGAALPAAQPGAPDGPPGSAAPAEPPWMPAPWAPAPWTPPQWGGGDATTAVGGAPPRRPGRNGGGARRFTRGWLPVAMVAAVVGGGVAAGVTEGLRTTGSASLTVDEGTAAPGAATVTGNVTIPQLVKKVLPAIVSIEVKGQGGEDEGTGMIITSGGEVITNNHVIELAETTRSATITVTESGKTTSTKQPATLVGADQTTDVALLQVKTAPSDLPTVTLGDSSKAQVGDAVVAIGNALGLAAGTPTVTQGIISALGRTVTAGGDSVADETLTNMIQTDAAINPGNSGGPLIDTAGQVIGMNTAIAGGTADGTSAQDIGFAIPSGKVESLLPGLEKGGTASGAALGVTVETLTPQLRQEYGFTPTSGAVVQTVVARSPAAEAGLRQGDVIVAIGATTIATADQVQSVTQTYKPGDQVQVTYFRGDLKKSATVTLESETQLQQQEAQGITTTTVPSGTPTAEISPFGL